MAKIEIKFLNDNGEVKPKDDLIKEILWEAFGSESDPAKCEGIIQAAEQYGFYQMGADMRRTIESEKWHNGLALIYRAAGEMVIQEGKVIY